MWITDKCGTTKVMLGEVRRYLTAVEKALTDLDTTLPDANLLITFRGELEVWKPATSRKPKEKKSA